jgi:hypothetical protein
LSKELETPQWNYKPRLPRSPQIRNNSQPLNDLSPHHPSFANNKKLPDDPHSHTYSDDQEHMDNDDAQHNKMNSRKRDITDYYNTTNGIPEDTTTDSNNNTQYNTRNMGIDRKKNMSEYYNNANDFSEDNNIDGQEITQEHFQPNNLPSPREHSTLSMHF